MLRRRSSKYNRIVSFTNLVDQIVPGFTMQAARSLLRLKHVPIAGCQIKLLAYGTGTTVFLLQNDHDSQVLKVFRRSLGKPLSHIWELAKEFQEKYNTLVACFNDPDEVVVPSTFLVLHGPLLSVPSAAIIQPFISGKKLDLFLDFSIEEVIQLGKDDARLRRQLLDFSSRLFKAMEETDRCFDLVGRENLMMVETNGSFELKIVDIGIFDLHKIRRNTPARFNRLQSHLCHLQSIQEGLKMI
jgi:hypothetical protein